jgi:hypothetical protein
MTPSRTLPIHLLLIAPLGLFTAWQGTARMD